VPKYVDLDTGDAFPASWTDALQEYISAMQGGFCLSLTTAATALTVFANTNDGQVAISLSGKWRYITGSLTSAAGSGSAGWRTVWVTGSANSISGGDVDSTVYAFALEVRSSGSPSTALSRQVGRAYWDGSKYTCVQNWVSRPMTTVWTRHTSPVSLVGGNSHGGAPSRNNWTFAHGCIDPAGVAVRPTLIIPHGGPLVMQELGSEFGETFPAATNINPVNMAAASWDATNVILHAALNWGTSNNSFVFDLFCVH
jgi:hypothetical protein